MEPSGSTTHAVCNLYEQRFIERVSTATAEQKQEYADCVRILYPRHHDAEATYVGAGIALLIFLSFVAIAAYLTRDWPAPK